MEGSFQVSKPVEDKHPNQISTVTRANLMNQYVDSFERPTVVQTDNLN